MNPNIAKKSPPLVKPCADKAVKVTQTELSVHCPRADASLWDAHPRVYIPVEENGGSARCPYCGTVYTLVD